MMNIPMENSTTITLSLFALKAQHYAFLCRSVILFTLSLSIALPGNVMADNHVVVGTDFVASKGYLFRTSLETGGENLLSISDDNNDTTSLTGGRGTGFELGVRFDLRPFQRPAFETELTMGMKKATLESGDGAAEFSRTTITLSQFYRFKNGLRIGMGAGMNVAAKLDINITGYTDANTSLNATPEYRAMLEYGLTRRLAIGARYRAITWTSNNNSVDGSNVGVYLGFQTAR